MKTLVFGAGPLGSLYACLLHKAGNDVTILARNDHYKFLKENGIVLYNEFEQRKIIDKVNVTDSFKEDDFYDLLIVIMRKNSLKKILPLLSKNRKIPNILFMGNNTLGFAEYLKYIAPEKLLFGFPGGGGSRIKHIVHYIDCEKAGAKRMPITLGEIDGELKERTLHIQNMFEAAGIPVNICNDMDGWLKYHVAFVNPIAGALLKAGDNYKLANDKKTIIEYIRAVKEGGKVLKAIGFKKRYPFKFNLFYWMPEWFLHFVLKQLFNSKFAEVAMMMHARAAADEMQELAGEFKTLKDQTSIKTPNLDELASYIPAA